MARKTNPAPRFGRRPGETQQQAARRNVREVHQIVTEGQAYAQLSQSERQRRRRESQG